MAGGDLDVTRQHGVEERVELLRYLPGEVALGASRTLFHWYVEDDRDPTRPLGHLRTQDCDPFTLVTSLAPHHRRLRKSEDQRSGSLVLLGSVLAKIAAPLISPYGSSKAAVHSLARAIQVEARRMPGVEVSIVSPGGVDTPIYEQAATYGDSVGRPPFPVSSPEAVARRVLAVADGGWHRSQVGLGNDVLRLGFTLLPVVYDAMVGPLFKVVAQDLTRPVQQGPGNVLSSHEQGNALHGSFGNALIGIGRNLLAVGRRGLG